MENRSTSRPGLLSYTYVLLSSQTLSSLKMDLEGVMVSDYKLQRMQSHLGDRTLGVLVRNYDVLRLTVTVGLTVHGLESWSE